MTDIIERLKVLENKLDEEGRYVSAMTAQYAALEIRALRSKVELLEDELRVRGEHD